MEPGPGDRTASALFAGFRALGLFSSDIPHVVRYSALKRRFYVTTCVGKSFHTYDVSGSARASREAPAPEQLCGNPWSTPTGPACPAAPPSPPGPARLRAQC